MNDTLDLLDTTLVPAGAADTGAADPLLGALHERLAGCIADGTLVLPAQAIASSAVSELLSAFAGGSTLVIDAPTVTLADDALTVAGRFAPLPGLPLAAEARFFVEEGRLQLALAARLAPGQALGIRRLAESFLPGTTLPEDLPDLGLVAMVLSSSPLSAVFTFGNGQGGWTVPLGPVGVTVGDVSLALSRSEGAEGEPARTLATLSGDATIGGAAFGLRYSPPGALVVSGRTPTVAFGDLVDDLCGHGVSAQLQLPAAIAGLQLPAAEATLDVPAKRFTLEAHGGVFDTVGLAVGREGRDGTGAWGFTAGFAPRLDWKFSDLNPAFAPLDGLTFDDLALVVSTAADGSLPLPGLLADREDLQPVRGLNMVASLNLAGLGADKLLGLETLAVHAVVGTTLDSVLLEAEVGGHLKLSDTVEMRDLAFRLHPAPNAFEVSVLGRLGVNLSGSPLVFTGAMSVTPTGASFAATMAGDWVEPFGAKGVTVSNLAVELGIAFTDGLPIVGLAGGMTLGSAHGKAAVRVDSGNPSLSMLAVDFDTLHLGEVITDLCDAAVHDLIPPDAAHTILNVNLNEAEFAVVPQRTHIGELVYEQGIHIAADIDCWGFQAEGRLSLDFANGVLLDAEIDPIVVGDAFRFTGAHGQGRPTLHLAVGPATAPGVKISGDVMLLGIEAQADIALNDSGFRFELDGRLLDLFEASIVASGGHLGGPGGEDGFMVAAAMKNDLFAVLREHATQAIAQASRDATAKIADAQRDVDAAQRDVDGLNRQIGTQRATVQAERDQAQRTLADAQRTLADAQGKVDGLNQQIAAMRSTIQGERAQAQRGIDAASAKVAAAQSGVNSIQSQIDALNRWYYRLPKVAVPWKDSQASRAIDFGARQAALYTALGSAKGALATAQGVLDLARRAAVSTPVDADPRMLGLFTALGTATTALKAAQGAVSLARSAIAATPIDADPRVAGLIAARETATLALRVATGVLTGARQVSTGALAAADHIARFGLGGVVDVRAACFEASLALAKGGRVFLSADVDYLGKPQHVQWSVDFADPVAAAEALAKRLIGA